jgi:membrane protein implicated in regulation of membrane protease activity
VEWLWILVIVLFLGIEAISFNLVTIWFSLGALGAFITAYFTNDITIQIIVFVLITVVSLVLTRPIVKRYINLGIVKLNADALVGKTGKVITRIEPDEFGVVKIEGKEWTAKSNSSIKANTKVEILGIEGVKLIVRKKEEK